LIGAGVGVVGGVVLGVWDLCSTNDGFICLDSGWQVAALAGITGAGGALIGAFVGSLIHHEKWATVGEGARVSPMIVPSGKGTAVGLSIKF
jgi:hypothetical protein